MVSVTISLLFSILWVGNGERIKLTLEADRPSERVQLFHRTTLKCCYSSGGRPVDHTWTVTTLNADGTNLPQTVDMSDHRLTTDEDPTPAGGWCRMLTLRMVQFNDSGLYRCLLNSSALNMHVFTHGTFLQVYKPVEKILNISESTKNQILTAEAVLLLLIVLLPGAALLCKSKKIHELEKKKERREEENIYEGLRIDDFTPYEEIQHCHVEATYEDVYLKDQELHPDRP